MVKRGLEILICLLVCGLWTGTAAALTVQAIADRDRMAVSESLQLQLQLDDIPDTEPDFTSLQKNWEILGRSQSSQRRIVNGSYSSSVVFSLTLRPRRQGQLPIPPVCFDKDCSRPLTIDVSSQSSLENPVDEQVQLEAEVLPRQTVVMGQVLLKVRLSLKLGLPEGKISEPRPAGVHALVKPLGPGVVKHEKRSNGVLYQVLEREYAIYPQESGQMQIPPLQYDGVVAGGPSRFDPFGRQGMAVRVTSQPLTVAVAPLPADLGGRPWLPAASVSLQDDWQQQPPQLVVGEPATRTLRLSADGVLSEQLPELNPAVPVDFKSYLDPPSRQDQPSKNGITGLIEQKISLIPMRSGHYQLPGFDLDWWDISASRWRTAHLDALSLEVAPAANAKGPAAPSAATAAPEPAVAPGPEPQLPAAPAAGPGFWPWLSAVLALGWLLTLLMLWRKGQGRGQVPAGRPVKDTPVIESSARQAVIAAARSNDPQAARQALVRWSRTLWPQLAGGSYEQLYSMTTPELREELELLDATLYGACSQPWDGRRLAACLAAWRPDSVARHGLELPPLYPNDPLH